MSLARTPTNSRWTSVLVAILALVATVSMLAPVSAFAWWNADWSYRKKITLHTARDGAALSGPVDEAPVLVRLHTGNFPFVDAKENGEDLRFVAGDDKTPLKFHVERFDGLNGIALVWVRVPRLHQKTDNDVVWLYYGNPNAPAGADAAGTFDDAQTAAYHFAQNESAPVDSTAYQNGAQNSSAASIAEGAIDHALRFAATSSFTVPAKPALKVAAGGALSITAWIKTSTLDGGGRLLTLAGNDGEFVIDVKGASLQARIRAPGSQIETPSIDRLSPGTWHHVAVTASDRLTVYVDGEEVAAVAAKLPELAGPVTVGAIAEIPGFSGDLDELQFSRTARSKDWIRLAALGHGPDARIVEYGQDEAQADGGQYLALLRVLAGAVSRDAWVIIGLIVILGFLSTEAIIVKARLLRRMENANAGFLGRFRDLQGDLAALAGSDPSSADSTPKAGGVLRDSSLFRMYAAAIGEVRKSLAAESPAHAGMDASDMDVVKAAIDSAMVEEANRMNKNMVMLTLSVSGAPFLGLLGTVVGIMVTFATIAMQGDVNVNTIAPGVAAAITTTVAGLVVAIPVMFAYNFLALRIRALTTAMELFSNELLSRIARSYRKA
ncbi:MAG: DUF2341 domain-containing protein [Betaproteobacteria bacterium]|nr:DUF2341 domain-containing protein [Betaproteobacteria bacterium]